jgi:hypothetical protein
MTSAAETPRTHSPIWIGARPLTEFQPPGCVQEGHAINPQTKSADGEFCYFRPGWTFGDDRCCRMGRRNPWPGGILNRTGAPAAIHRGVVSDQHTGRLARRDRIRGLYAGRCPSGKPDRSPARPTDLSRLKRAQRAVLFRRCAVRLSAAGAWIPGHRRHRARRHVYAGLAGAHARCRGDNARITAWYTSSFTIGASLSFLLGRVQADL